MCTPWRPPRRLRCSHRAERPRRPHAGPGWGPQGADVSGETAWWAGSVRSGSGVTGKKCVRLTRGRLRRQTCPSAGTVLPAQQGARAHPAVQPARSTSFGKACGRRSGAAAGATLGRRLTPAAAFLVTSVFPSSQRPWEAIDGGHWAADGARGGARPDAGASRSRVHGRAAAGTAGGRRAPGLASLQPAPRRNWVGAGAANPPNGPEPFIQPRRDRRPTTKGPLTEGPRGWLWWHTEGRARTGCS